MESRDAFVPEDEVSEMSPFLFIFGCVFAIASWTGWNISDNPDSWFIRAPLISIVYAVLIFLALKSRQNGLAAFPFGMAIGTAFMGLIVPAIVALVGMGLSMGNRRSALIAVVIPAHFLMALGLQHLRLRPATDKKTMVTLGIVAGFVLTAVLTGA